MTVLKIKIFRDVTRPYTVDCQMNKTDIKVVWESKGGRDKYGLASSGESL